MEVLPAGGLNLKLPGWGSGFTQALLGLTWGQEGVGLALSLRCRSTSEEGLVPPELWGSTL